MSKLLIELVRNEFSDAVTASHSERGDETVVIKAASWLSLGQFLRDDPACDMALLVDLTAVDFPDQNPRFEVVAHLASLTRGHRLRVKAKVGQRDASRAEIDSWSGLWGSANWAERECFDMFGIIFKGHPDLRRILLYPEFVGHPLRRDYPAQKIQPLVPFREVDNIDKLPPFGPTEGMSFGRQTHDQWQKLNQPDDDL